MIESTMDLAEDLLSKLVDDSKSQEVADFSRKRKEEAATTLLERFAATARCCDLNTSEHQIEGSPTRKAVSFGIPGERNSFWLSTDGLGGIFAGIGLEVPAPKSEGTIDLSDKFTYHRPTRTLQGPPSSIERKTGLPIYTDGLLTLAQCLRDGMR